MAFPSSGAKIEESVPGPEQRPERGIDLALKNNKRRKNHFVLCFGDDRIGQKSNIGMEATTKDVVRGNLEKLPTYLCCKILNRYSSKNVFKIRNDPVLFIGGSLCGTKFHKIFGKFYQILLLNHCNIFRLMNLSALGYLYELHNMEDI